MPSLKLNEYGDKFKEFYGKNAEQMPNLIEEDRVLLSVAGLMQRRLEVLTASEEVKDAWWNNHFDTGDAIIYHPGGNNLKIVLDAEPMKELNLQSKLSNGALVLPDSLYDKLDGVEFRRDELEKCGIVETSIRKYWANHNPIWRTLAREDMVLLNEYINVAFAQAKEKYGYDRAMGIWLLIPQERTTGRLLSIEGFDNYSLADGSTRLNNSSGRLVGVES